MTKKQFNEAIIWTCTLVGAGWIGWHLGYLFWKVVAFLFA